MEIEAVHLLQLGDPCVLLMCYCDSHRNGSLVKLQTRNDIALPTSTHLAERVLSLGLDVCKSHCSPLDSDREVIYSSSLNILYDGTTCVTPQSKGVCISGSCKPISCNGTLWVESTRDECGVWCGDESSCVKVTGSFGDVKSPGGE